MNKTLLITGLILTALITTPSFAQEERSPLRAQTQIERNPCTGMHGAMLRRCAQMETVRAQEQRESRKATLQKRMAKSSYGRRIASLRARQLRRKSNTDSRMTPGKATDLNRKTLYQSRLLRYHGSESAYAKTTSGPLLRARTSAGVRGSNLMLPVCSRRDGLRLIQCMRDLGVEITPYTVGKDTWEIYQRLYIR